MARVGALDNALMSITFHKPNGSPLKVGVVANEFFDLGYSRMGGFGWATRQLARCFGGDPGLGVDIVYVDGETRRKEAVTTSTLHGCRVIAGRENRLRFVRRVWREKIDLLISIDYRRSYRTVFHALPRTPVLVWVRDPRTPEDVQRIGTVQIPGREGIRPSGLGCPDATSLAWVVRWSRLWGRRVLFGTPSPALREKVFGAYAIRDVKVELLPNIIDFDPGTVVKGEKPSVVFLARLDSYKRPWLFAELARHFPEVDFIFLGQAHFNDANSWQPVDLPANVRLMGHVDGDEKIRILSAAWVLINTSIHEGLAVSFQEALKCETPLLSCIDTEQVATRFGVFVGRQDGSGLELIPRFRQGLRDLLENRERRERLGRAGRVWVSEVHTRERFLEAFRRLCVDAGVL